MRRLFASSLPAVMTSLAAALFCTACATHPDYIDRGTGIPPELEPYVVKDGGDTSDKPKDVPDKPTDDTDKPTAAPDKPSDDASDVTLGKRLVEFSNDEKLAKLKADMDAGTIPVACEVLYDQMGSLPSVTITDEETIARIYHLLEDITVQEESDTSVTDSYHHVSFTLQDATVVGFSFEGEGNLYWRGTLYSVTGDGALWNAVQELQKEEMSSGTSPTTSTSSPTTTTSGEAHTITVTSGKDLILSCPSAAQEGEMVTIETKAVLGGELKVLVDGKALDTDPLSGKGFAFVMPGHDVSVIVEVEDDLIGS